MQRVMKDGLFGGGFGGPRYLGRRSAASAGSGDSRERGAHSNFEPNSIDPGRLMELTGQLSASKRGTNFRKVLRSINFSPPQAFDENGVHWQCRGHQANDIVIP